MYHDSDKHAFDRVSDADEDRNHLIAPTDLQNVQNDNSNTNNTDNTSSQERQVADQLTNNIILSPCMLHGHQLTIPKTDRQKHRVEI